MAKITRRGFLKGLAGMVLAGALVINPAYAQEPKTTQTPAKAYSSLAQLTEKGLPKELESAGFKLVEYRDRKSDTDLVIIGENHEYKGVKQGELKLLEYLADNYGIDSIGLEGIWETNGKIDPNEIYEEGYLGKDTLLELEKISGKKTPRTTLSQAIDEMYPGLIDFSKRKSIFVYGFEDQALYAESSRLEILLEIIKEARKQSNENKIDYKKIKEIEQLEAVYRALTRNHSDFLEATDPKLRKPLQIPNLREFIEHPDYEENRTGLVQNYIIITSFERNSAFSRNILEKTKRKGLNKNIIITGFKHTDGIPFVHEPLQIQIPYNYLIISTPGIEKKEPLKIIK